METPRSRIQFPRIHKLIKCILWEHEFLGIKGSVKIINVKCILDKKWMRYTSVTLVFISVLFIWIRFFIVFTQKTMLTFINISLTHHEQCFCHLENWLPTLTCLIRVDLPPMFGPVTNTHGASALPLSWPSSSSPLGQAMKMSLGMKSSPKKVLVTQGWRDPLRSRKGGDWDPSPGRTISGLTMGPSPLWLYRDMLNSTSGGENNRNVSFYQLLF